MRVNGLSYWSEANDWQRHTRWWWASSSPPPPSWMIPALWLLKLLSFVLCCVLMILFFLNFYFCSLSSTLCVGKMIPFLLHVSISLIFFLFFPPTSAFFSIVLFFSVKYVCFFGRLFSSLLSHIHLDYLNSVFWITEAWSYPLRGIFMLIFMLDRFLGTWVFRHKTSSWHIPSKLFFAILSVCIAESHRVAVKIVEFIYTISLLLLLYF